MILYSLNKYLIGPNKINVYNIFLYPIPSFAISLDPDELVSEATLVFIHTMCVHINN